MDIYESWLDVKMSSIKGSHDPKSYRAREIVQDFIEKFVKLDKEIQLESEFVETIRKDLVELTEVDLV